ncbi:Uncharacterised protein [Pseudomonas fluorescens]|uniref:Uncharacterized protein n=1 Tax=Pseudomonas fluorescens TaxID=294 RepID=A0A3S4T0H1_PSEFL|nr:Uncharacterised protein [Pseudomonas fluorescens]
MEHCRQVIDFHWYRRRKDVANVRNQGPHLFQTLSLVDDVDD